MAWFLHYTFRSVCYWPIKQPHIDSNSCYYDIDHCCQNNIKATFFDRNNNTLNTISKTVGNVFSKELIATFTLLTERYFPEKYKKTVHKKYNLLVLSYIALGILAIDKIVQRF